MPNLIVNTFLILLLSTCGIILGSYYIQKHANVTYVNGKLYDLENVIDALYIVDIKNKNDQLVKEKLEMILAKNMLDLSTKSPDIYALQDTPTNVLCRILQYHRHNTIGINDSGSTPAAKYMELVSEYLVYVEQALRSKTEESSIPYQHCNTYFNIKD